MIGFMLGRSMIDCPKYWENFIDAIPAVDRDSDKEVPIRVINRELRSYNARYRSAIGEYLHDYIEFSTEQDYTMFVLRWS